MGKTGEVCSVKDTGAFIKFERDHAALTAQKCLGCLLIEVCFSKINYMAEI